MAKFLFHLGHPAHYHLFRQTIKSLFAEKHQVFILIKKDVLEELLTHDGLPFFNILPKGRKNGLMGIALGVLMQDIGLLRFVLKNRPDFMFGTSFSIAHIGFFLRIPSYVFNEDDSDVVPLFAYLAYPFSTNIFSPICCNNGFWNRKTVKYSSYHELAYLHPEIFVKNRDIASKYVDLSKKVIILRFAQLTAHHDNGISGISDMLARKIIAIASRYGRVYITSERRLQDELEVYRLKINPIDIHHVMAFATLFVGDSQTMSAESAVLGVPFVRINDFVGRISYLNELEHDFGLGFGFRSVEAYKALPVIEEILANDNVLAEWRVKLEKLLTEKINLHQFILKFVKYLEKTLKS